MNSHFSLPFQHLPNPIQNSPNPPPKLTGRGIERPPSVHGVEPTEPDFGFLLFEHRLRTASSPISLSSNGRTGPRVDGGREARKGVAARKAACGFGYLSPSRIMELGFRHQFPTSASSSFGEAGHVEQGHEAAKTEASGSNGVIRGGGGS